MSNVKISELTDAATLTGVEEVPVVQSGATKRASIDDIKTYIGIDELSEIVRAQSSSQSQDSYLVGGGQVVWKSGYQYTVSPAVYYIHGVRYESVQQDVTLDAANGSNDRIDVIAVDDTGSVVNVTGTAGASPVQPDIDPLTQLQLTFVLVPVASTEPSDVTATDVYKENVEWTFSGSNTFNANSTTSPLSGSKAIEGTNVLNGQFIQLAAPSSFDLRTYTHLVLNIKSKGSWGPFYARLRWRLNGSVKGVEVVIDDGYWGFNSSTTSSYQQIAIPVSAFQITGGTLVNQLRLEISGTGTLTGFHTDDVILQGGIEQTIQLAAHTHDAADIVSGRLAPARIASSPSTGKIARVASDGTFEWVDIPRQISWYEDSSLSTGTSKGPLRRVDSDTTIVSCDLSVKTAPTGAAVIVDIKRSTTGPNGTFTTIFSSTPQIAAGAYEGSSTSLSITTLDAGDHLRMDVTQIGSTVSGSDLTVDLNMIMR